MAARKKRERAPVVPLPADFDAADLTEATFPDGTPTNPDGSVAASGTPMPVSKARQAGAITADAAQYNRSMAKRIGKKINGETNVPWNEKNAIHLFDSIRSTFPPSTIHICIKDLESQIDYRPVPMQLFKTSADFYKHLEGLQKGKSSRTYDVIFKDISQQSRRGDGVVTMPDMFDEPASQPQLQQQAPWMLPPYAQGMAGYPGPQPGIGYPQPHYAQPASQPPQVPQTQQQQPPQPIIIPPGTDPATAALLHQMQRDQSGLRDSLHMLTLQLSGALGGLEEFKRAQMQASFAAPPQAPPPRAAHAAPPPPPPVDPYRTATSLAPAGQPVFLGYGANGQPMYGYPPGSGVPGQPAGPWNPAPQQVAPPPPPSPPPPAQKPQTQSNQFSELAGTLMQTMQSLEMIKKAVGAPTGRAAAAAAEEEPEDDVPPAPPPIAEMIKVVSLGDPNDPNAPMLAHDAEGNIDWSATAMGNLPKLPGFLTRLAASASQVNNVVDAAQRQRPIMVEGHAVPTPAAIPRTPFIPTSIPVRNPQ
jgi:hypothetical protein